MMRRRDFLAAASGAAPLAGQRGHVLSWLGAAAQGGRSGVINVLDYGAKGDGETNDERAVAAALGALAPTGGTLLFPPGTYVGDFAVRQSHVSIYAYGASFRGALTLGDARARYAYLGLVGATVGGALTVVNNDNACLRDVQAYGGLVLSGGGSGGWCALTVLDNLDVSNPHGTGLAVANGAKFLRLHSVYIIAHDGQRPLDAYFEDCLIEGLTIEPAAPPGTGRSTALHALVKGTRTIGTLTTWDVNFDFHGSWENQYTVMGVKASGSMIDDWGVNNRITILPVSPMYDRSENRGRVALSGTGDAIYYFEHGLSRRPSAVLVTGGSADAMAQTWWTSLPDDRRVQITYSAPPPVGTLNLVFFFEAFA